MYTCIRATVVFFWCASCFYCGSFVFVCAKLVCSSEIGALCLESELIGKTTLLNVTRVFRFHVVGIRATVVFCWFASCFYWDSFVFLCALESFVFKSENETCVYLVLPFCARLTYHFIHDSNKAPQKEQILSKLCMRIFLANGTYFFGFNSNLEIFIQFNVTSHHITTSETETLKTKQLICIMCYIL